MTRTSGEIIPSPGDHIGSCRRANDETSVYPLGWLPMAGRDLREIIDPDWAAALEPVAGRITAMGDFLREEIAAGRRYLPAGENVLRAFQQPLDAVRVLIMGQD